MLARLSLSVPCLERRDLTVSVLLEFSELVIAEFALSFAHDWRVREMVLRNPLLV